jgi:hypothetical protein
MLVGRKIQRREGAGRMGRDFCRVLWYMALAVTLYLISEIFLDFFRFF